MFVDYEKCLPYKYIKQYLSSCNAAWIMLNDNIVKIIQNLIKPQQTWSWVLSGESYGLVVGPGLLSTMFVSNIPGDEQSLIRLYGTKLNAALADEANSHNSLEDLVKE